MLRKTGIDRTRSTEARQHPFGKFPRRHSRARPSAMGRVAAGMLGIERTGKDAEDALRQRRAERTR